MIIFQHIYTYESIQLFHSNISEERKVEKHLGNCSRGKCTGELACKELENNYYSCVCPHDSKAPNSDGSCPRYTGELLQNLPLIKLFHISERRNLISYFERYKALPFPSDHRSSFLKYL